MKKDAFFGYVRLLAAPAALCLFGLILVFSPDTASALVGKLLGWGLMIGGLGFGAAAVIDREKLPVRVLLALVLLALGSWMLRHPLALASGLGRFLGVLLMIQGVRGLFTSSYGHGRALAAVTGVLGLILTVMPMTTSRVVFTVLGCLLLITGVTEAVDRLRYGRIGSGGDDSIIDAL